MCFTCLHTTYHVSEVGMYKAICGFSPDFVSNVLHNHNTWLGLSFGGLFYSVMKRINSGQTDYYVAVCDTPRIGSWHLQGSFSQPRKNTESDRREEQAFANKNIYSVDIRARDLLLFC